MIQEITGEIGKERTSSRHFLDQLLFPNRDGYIRAHTIIVTL